MKERFRIRWGQDGENMIIRVFVHHDHVQTKLALDLLAQLRPSLYLYLSLPFHLHPTVSSSMRTSQSDSFTYNKHMSKHSGDIPQRNDQPRPGVIPDLTATPSTTPISTPAPRIGEQDGEWMN